MPSLVRVHDEPGDIKLTFDVDGSGAVDAWLTPQQAIEIGDDLLVAAARRLGSVKCRHCSLYLPPPERVPGPPGKAVGSTESSPMGRYVARKTLR